MKESTYQQHARIINGYAQYMTFEAAVAKYKRTNLGRIDFIIDQVAERIIAEAPPAEPVAQFEHAQEIVVIAGNHAGKKGWFNKLSGRGGRGEYCFIWFKTANMSGAHVKLSEIAPAGQQPTPPTPTTKAKANESTDSTAAAAEGAACAAATVTTYALLEPVAVLPDELLELTLINGEVTEVAVVRATKDSKPVSSGARSRMLHEVAASLASVSNTAAGACSAFAGAADGVEKDAESIKSIKDKNNFTE